MSLNVASDFGGISSTSKPYWETVKKAKFHECGVRGKYSFIKLKFKAVSCKELSEPHVIGVYGSMRAQHPHN